MERRYKVGVGGCNIASLNHRTKDGEKAAHVPNCLPTPEAPSR